MNLKGSVTIVTGSATGLGAAVAKAAAAKGGNVVNNYTKSKTEALEIAAVCNDMGVETLLCQADVSLDQDCRRMVSETVAKWGRGQRIVNFRDDRTGQLDRIRGVKSSSQHQDPFPGPRPCSRG